ncbi:MAG: type II secretion system protein [Elusimicrobiaceae bacterium]|nr:type II secretion system protein [Elusimicrobiaceae bacterium]
MNRKHGFTLIELLTVVLILGILTAIALPQYRKSIQRAEAADALINLKTMFDAAKRFYSYHSEWPSTFKGLDVEFLDITDNGEVGEFKYTLNASTRTASACRLLGSDTSKSFCLTAYYKDSNGNRDIYTCKDNSGGKYQSLCDSMCPTTSSGECTIE